MSTKACGGELVIATGNRGKLAELRSLLEPMGWQLHPQSELGVVEAEETGLSFVENAILKARNASRSTGLPALADDSGLAVDTLDGAPGIFSARYAGEDATDADNNRKLLEALAGIPEATRGASFHCAIAMVQHDRDPVPLICQASWRGRILEAPVGAGGFGYDPLFYLPDLGLTSAELEPTQKNQLSHRGQATRALVTALTP